MLESILMILGVLFLAYATLLFISLYNDRENRVVGIRDSQLQGVQLMVWFAFLGLFINVIFPWFVSWDRDKYPLVVLPILLAMLATLFWIIYPVKNPQEEADY